jgi:PST family polysaccharide transporter
VWLARYLGPTNFGTLNYAIAVIAILNPVATLGLEDVVVRDLIRQPDHSSEILGTTFFLQVSSGIATVFLAYILFSLIRTDDTTVRHLAAILSLGFIIQSTNMIRYWYQSQVSARNIVRAQILALVVASLLRISCILLSADITVFAWLIIVESALASFCLAINFLSRNKISLTWNFQRALSLVKGGWPLILSGLAVVTYMRIDQVMLGEIKGDHAVGIYTAALTISEAWYFVPIAIVASVFPGIIKSKQESVNSYAAKTQTLLSALLAMSVVVALILSLTSSQLVQFLFGSTFANAASVLAIHSWAGIFVALGVASGRWFVNEELQMLQLYKTLAGALANILLNILLIPKFGATGAAVATLLSFGIAAYISDFFFVRTRPMFFMKTRAILLVGLIEIWRK